MLELWNKLHFEEEKRTVYTMFKIFGTYICWINTSTTHYLTQMLFASNWRYRQAGKNSRMRTKVQGRLMQAR